MRGLTVLETEMVSGGNYTNWETDEEGRGVWECVYNDEGFLQRMTLHEDGGSNGGGWYGSFGGAIGPVGIGFSYAGGDVYGYISGGFGTPVDISFGYAADIDAHLGGWSVSGNGLPGGSLSFDENGVSSQAFQFGTPGANVSHEWNLSEFYRDMRSGLISHADTVAQGLIDMHYPDGYNDNQPYGTVNQR